MGPSELAPVRVTAWDPKLPKTRCIETPHYRLYTTIQDHDTQDQLAQVMEGAFPLYQALCPGQPVDERPSKAYIFQQRDEWAAFTEANGGQDAPVYLKINRGGYTQADWFATYWFGDRGTYAIAAHEGFHQFVARHYVGRIAPALEEGFACTFENLEFDGPRPRWNLAWSTKRARDLSNAMRAGRLWKLPAVLRLQPGEVIGAGRESIDKFYAQSWALALFLWEGENRCHRPALQRYFGDLAAGRAYRPAAYANLRPGDWNPDLSVLQLEHYLGVSLQSLEGAYQAFCLELARQVPAHDAIAPSGG